MQLKRFKILATLLIISFNTACSSEKEEQANAKAEEKPIKIATTNNKNEASISNPANNSVTLSKEAIFMAQINSSKVIEKEFVEKTNTTGVIKSLDTNTLNLTSLVGGRIITDNIRVGKYVKKGDVIATVQNSEVVKIYAQYIHEYHQNEVLIKQAKLRLELSEKNYLREKGLLKEGISSRKDFIQAESDYRIAEEEVNGLKEHRKHLRSEVESLLSTYNVALPNSEHIERINSVTPILAPQDGLITKKNIVSGSNITSDQVLCEISDTSKVFVEISILGKDINKVKLEDEVQFFINPEEKPLISKIDYIEPVINQEKQAFIARAELVNTDNKLKLNLFGNVVIINKDNKEIKPFITQDSIQSYKEENFVFKDLGNGKYQKKDVVLGKKTENGFLVEKGLKKGELIVSHGGFTLKAQLLKSQFSEGEE